MKNVPVDFESDLFGTTCHRLAWISQMRTKFLADVSYTIPGKKMKRLLRKIQKRNDTQTDQRHKKYRNGGPIYLKLSYNSLKTVQTQIFVWPEIMKQNKEDHLE